jgi:predicted transcriptional regulator of viral defense system
MACIRGPLGAYRVIDIAISVAGDRLKWPVLLFPRFATLLTNLDKPRSLSDNVCIRFRILVCFAHMMETPDKMPDHNALYQIAEQQAGYFTVAQARQAGFSSSLLSYHLDAGRFERVKPRVYRFVQFPASRHEDLYVASLQAGPEAVISHDSALALYDLSDLLPDQVHVTIPRTASRRRPGLRLHTNQLEPEDITRYEGLPVTTVLRTLADVTNAGLADEQVQQAIREALRRGLVTRESLLRLAASRGARLARLIEETLREGRN